MDLNILEPELTSLELKNNKSNDYTNFKFDKVFTQNSTQEEVNNTFN